jgi:type IV pilus assembly protein PilM
VSDSFWKKEISFRRKATPGPEEQPTEVALPPAVEAVLTPAPEPDLEPIPEPPVGAAYTIPTPPQPPRDAEGTPLPPLSAGDYGWLTTSFDPNEIPEDIPAIAPPPLSAPAPAAYIQAVPDPASAAADVDAGPQLASVVPPPIGAQKVPFWKKELPFSKKPKAAREPKPAKEPKAKKPRREKDPNATPFWKKEIGRSRKPKAKPEATQPTVKKPPLWKRQLALPKLERGPKQAKQPRAKTPRGGAPKQAKGGVVGLKIGASQVAAARITNNGSPQLVQLARAPLPDGVVVGGELRDVVQLSETLNELFTKHKLPKRGVRLGIANNRIGVRTFEIVGIEDPKQLANAIRFRAQETLPIPLEEAVLDWQVLSEETNEAGQTTRRILLVVAYRELVDQYIDACKRAGIRLAGIDLEAFAMLRALTVPPAADAPPPTGAHVLVNVGHDRSTFAVSDGRICEFTRVLGWGGQNLSVAIAQALDRTPSEVHEIKHALSLVAQTEPPEGVPPDVMATARDAALRELQVFARELVSSLRFYQNQPGSLGIGELVLTGGTAYLPGFVDELNRLIGVPVRVGDPLNRLALPKKFRAPEDAPLGSLTVAIGLAIED